MSESVLDAIALRRAQSLTNIVQQELERMIVTGELRAGERLNEKALAHQFGVSRGPVREALRSLERAQLVCGRLNQGFFVRRVSAEEIEEIYDVRAVVYGFVCQRLAERITDEELASLEECAVQMDSAIAANDPATYYRLNLQFHEQCITFARHRCARQTYQALIKETHLSRQRSLDDPGRMQESNDEHRALLDALRLGDAVLARRLGEEHALAGLKRWKTAVDAGEAPPAEQHGPGPRGVQGRPSRPKRGDGLENSA